MKIMTYNIAHGRGNSLSQLLLSKPAIERNLRQIARQIQIHAPDVVALQEADGPSAWSGSFDHVAFLADEAGYPEQWRGEHGVYRLRNSYLTYGTALLSREELTERHSRRFGLSWRDSKGFVSALWQHPVSRSLDVTFFSLHLDFLRRTNRQQQLLMLSHSIAELKSRNYVVMGDFNCSWNSDRGLLRSFCAENGLVPYKPRMRQPTFPTRSPRRRLDWILVSRNMEIVRQEVLSTGQSDHLPVIAELVFRDILV